MYFSGNTRVVNQKELEFFREELQSRMSSSYNVILKEKTLPMSLLNDHQKVHSFSVNLELSYLFGTGRREIAILLYHLSPLSAEIKQFIILDFQCILFFMHK